MALQPAFYLVGIMSAVVVHHQVQFQLRSVLGIDLTQEAQEFLVPVPWKAAAADCSSRHVQRCEDGNQRKPRGIRLTPTTRYIRNKLFPN
jgi:hypothetical protein